MKTYVCRNMSLKYTAELIHEVFCDVRVEPGLQELTPMFINFGKIYFNCKFDENLSTLLKSSLVAEKIKKSS